MAIAEVSEDGDAPSGRDVALPEALDLLIRAATLLFVNGQTTERAKKSVEDLAHSFGFHAAVFLHWDDLRIQISDGVASRSETVAVNPSGVHMGIVAATMREMVDAPRDGAAATLRSRLAEIEKMAPVSTLRLVVMAAAGAAALAVIFGAADIVTLLLVALSGGAGAFLRRQLAPISSNPFLQPFGAALLAGVVGAIVVDLHVGVVQRLVALCPCMILVPGPHLLNGTIDLMRARIALGRRASCTQT